MWSRRQLLAAPLAAATRKPNLVLIVSDDHHWQCLGAAGNPHIQTPHLDRLAARGVLFRQGIVSTSQCAPSRGILLSGLETYQTGLDCNDHTAFRTFAGPTVVERLARAGYETNLVGKWHIRPAPRECGFQKAPLWLQPGSSRYLNPKLRHGIDAADEETPGHITDLFSRAAVDVVRSAREPYLLWLAYNAPHTPWTASEPFRKAVAPPPAHPKVEGFDWATYYAVISELDAGIGRVVDAIERAGQWDNTLLVFVGDNGYLCRSRGLSGKVYSWEESIRVPFLVSGGLVRRSAVSEATVASVDVPATLLDVAGLRPPLAGASFLQVLNGGRFARDAAFASWNDGRPEALMIRRAVEPYRVVRTAEHKYTLWESRRDMLVDLRNDPFETRNFESPRLRDRMRERLRARMKETADPAIAWL